MQQTYDSGKFEAVQTRALALAEWSGFDARAAQSAKNGKHRGRGMASFLEWTGGNVFEERVTVNVSGDGFIEIFSATQAMGQGIATSYAQLAVDVFGVPIEKVRIVQGDTDRGTGFGSAGSRSIFVGGSAVKVASQQTVAKAQALAAEALETAERDIEYAEGVFSVAGTDRRIGLFELAGKQSDRQVYIESTSAVQAPSWPNACHICEVEVDPDTGVVRVLRYTAVDDVGVILDQTIVEGQITGGVAQGLGQVFGERLSYSADGQLQNASFMDYPMPHAGIIGKLVIGHQEVPCRNNPLGVKGAGESGVTGALPSTISAILHALTERGVKSLDMPFTPERVWAALNRAAA
jgi:carbon-monoxide dehydrogenase large subunit